MADDIDDLLDEVEANLFKSSNKNSQNTSRSSHRVNNDNMGTSKRTYSRKDEELNSMIDDICDMPEPLLCDVRTNKLTTISHTHSSQAKKKCFSAVLGGTNIEFGLSTTAHQRACDHLRCTDCDFKVSIFENFMWDTSTDYLFLRNNMPEFSRLKTHLTRRSGYRAYACQCKWRNTNIVVELSNEKELKWVCGRHD